MRQRESVCYNKDFPCWNRNRWRDVSAAIVVWIRYSSYTMHTKRKKLFKKQSEIEMKRERERESKNEMEKVLFYWSSRNVISKRKLFCIFIIKYNWNKTEMKIFVCFNKINKQFLLWKRNKFYAFALNFN